ncbi:hypothetical protein LC593_22430 [Nostoc sp. CHAB 5844]|nr:hypothetical protein [Nostoc sp. CHAB 5844]
MENVKTPFLVPRFFPFDGAVLNTRPDEKPIPMFGGQYFKLVIFFGEVAPTIKSGQLLVHPLHNTNNISIHNNLFANLAKIKNEAVSPALCLS